MKAMTVLNYSELFSDEKKSNLVAQILKECSYNEMKALCNMKLSRTFKDGFDKARVDHYAPLLSKLERIEIYTHISCVTECIKPSQLDIMTLKKPDHTEAIIGKEACKFTGGEEDDVIRCSRGRAGEADTLVSIATLASVANRVVQSEKKKAEGQIYQNIAYSASNSLAPTERFCETMVTLPIIAEPNALHIEAVAESLRKVPVKNLAARVELLNGVVAKQKTSKGEMPIVKFEVGKKNTMKFLEGKIEPQCFQGDYPQVANAIEKYRSGTKNPGLKRVAKNLYLGVPVEGLPYEHVTSLYEAGVQYGDRVFVPTSDGNLLSMLRSNFGPNIVGVGRGPQLIAEEKARISVFDWVYYPKPIILERGTDFSANLEKGLMALRKMLSIYAIGKTIMHISPLFFYCEKFVTALGLEVGDKIRKTPAAMKLMPKEEQIEPRFFRGGKESNDWTTEILPCPMNILYGDFVEQSKAEMAKEKPEFVTLTTEMRDILTRCGVMYARMLEVDEYSQVGYSQISHIKIPMVPTALSYRGCMMYVQGGERVPFMNVLGYQLHYMKEVFRQLWCPSYISPHIYRIRFFRKGAKVENLQYDDVYSPFYTMDIEEELQEDPKEVIAREKDADNPKGKEKEDSDEDLYGEVEGDGMRKVSDDDI